MEDKIKQEILDSYGKAIKFWGKDLSVEPPKVEDRAEILGIKLPFNKIPLPDKVYNTLKETKELITNTITAPVQQINEGVQLLQDNPLAGAIKVGSGVINTAFNLTGIPLALTELRQAIKLGLGDNMAKAFDTVVNLPTTAVDIGNEVVNKIIPKEKQIEFIRNSVIALLSTGKPEYQVFAPLLTEKGQQELAQGLDEINKLSANLLAFKAIEKTLPKPVQPIEVRYGESSSELPTEAPPSEVQPQTIKILDENLQPLPKPNEPIIRIIQRKDGKVVYYDDTNKKFLSKEEANKFLSEYETPTIIERKTQSGRRQYINIKEDRPATNEEMENYRAGKYQIRKQQEQPQATEPIAQQTTEQATEQPISETVKPTEKPEQPTEQKTPAQTISETKKPEIEQEEPLSKITQQAEQTTKASEQTTIEANKPKPAPISGVTTEAIEQKINEAVKKIDAVEQEVVPEQNQTPKTFAEKVKQAKQKSFDEIAKEYEQEYDKLNKFTLRATTEIKKVSQDALEQTRNTLETLSSRAKDVNSDVFRQMRKYAFAKSGLELKVGQIYEAFVKAEKKALNPKMQARFDAALDNPKFFNEAEKIAEQYGFKKEFDAVISIRDELSKALDIELQPGHWDRIVKDYRGFMQDFYNKFPDLQKPIEKMLSEVEAKRGRLTEQEKAQYISNAFRGLNPKFNPIRLSDIPNAKERVLPVLDGEFKKYYYDSKTAGYLGLMDRVRSIMERKFFGVKGFDWQEGIGKYLMELEKSGKIGGQDAWEIKNILQTMFNPKNPTSRFTRFLHQTGIAFKLGFNLLAGLTQVKDIGYYLGFAPKETINSLWNIAVLDVIRQIAGKETKSLKLQDINIDNRVINKIFADYGYRNRFLDFTLKLNQMYTLDQLGKHVGINTMFKYYKKLAQQNKLEGNTYEAQRLKLFFGEGEELKGVIRDLKAGKFTDRTAFLLYNELAERHPVSLMEYPKYYIQGGNWRILYFLKGFNIKQLNYVFDETIKNLFSGDRTRQIEGMKRLVTLVPTLMLVGATVDEIKQWLMEKMSGKKSELTFTDNLIENLLSLVMFSRYDTRALEGDTDVAIIQKVAPPLDHITDVMADAVNLIAARNKTIKSIKHIPYVGRILWANMKTHVYKDIKPEGVTPPNQLLKPYEQFNPF